MYPKIQLRNSFIDALLSIVLVTIVASPVPGQQPENIGKVTQELVGGSLVSPETQEAFGLLSLSNRCSASLLRNNWAITAAHCIDSPDPNRPGEFIMVPQNSVTLTANWKKVQVQQSMRIISYRPEDVAIIRVGTPFVVAGSDGAFNREVYSGPLVPATISAFGRGIVQFAQGRMPNATPSVRDGLYRSATFVTDVETSDVGNRHLIWFDSAKKPQIAGGDSGGPTLVHTVRGDMLFGVHSLCDTTCTTGNACKPGSWDWITSTPRCAEAPVAPLWDEINRSLGAFVPPKPIEETTPFGPSAEPPAFIYAVRPDGMLSWYRHDGARYGVGLQSPNSWKGARTVGRGWDGLEHVFAGGGNVIYGITPDGRLLWYRHNAFNTGLGMASPNSWSPRKDVGRGWNGLKHVFSGGSGVIYTIAADGKLRWYRHLAYESGAGLETPGSWHPSSGKEVGTGWGDVRAVFAAGDGTIYAVMPDGTLRWFRHDGYLDGRGGESPGAWVGPKPVGTGWHSFTQVFTKGPDIQGMTQHDGVIIYGVMPDGTLKWYKHKGWKDGTNSWIGARDVGRGWNGMLGVIALLPGSPQIVR